MRAQDKRASRTVEPMASGNFPPPQEMAVNLPSVKEAVKVITTPAERLSRIAASASFKLKPQTDEIKEKAEQLRNMVDGEIDPQICQAALLTHDGDLAAAILRIEREGWVIRERMNVGESMNDARENDATETDATAVGIEVPEPVNLATMLGRVAIGEPVTPSTQTPREEPQKVEQEPKMTQPSSPGPEQSPQESSRKSKYNLLETPNLMLQTSSCSPIDRSPNIKGTGRLSG
ncbi:hypothetical protein AB1Y20_020247 [Prymnesium parvum]|uniref:UBA domain-containing protein n=1 Tax=Prymnesium parvum TaxID=97485 RepID=A0AB34JWK0_PRYPA|mmetsp:Transcript_15063/g.37644  ORF Transcript_15063/g.37644 Transcript_15063/m.37644 type:complete len:233 (-) Transcript_15063:39-737(-)